MQSWQTEKGQESDIRQEVTHPDYWSLLHERISPFISTNSLETCQTHQGVCKETKDMLKWMYYFKQSKVNKALHILECAADLWKLALQRIWSVDFILWFTDSLWEATILQGSGKRMFAARKRSHKEICFGKFERVWNLCTSRQDWP